MEDNELNWLAIVTPLGIIIRKVKSSSSFYARKQGGGVNFLSVRVETAKNEELSDHRSSSWADRSNRTRGS